MNLTTKISKILSGELESDELKYNSLLPEHEMYISHSPKPIGYESIEHQKLIYLHTLMGWNVDMSILDIGAGRGDIYKFLNDMYVEDEMAQIEYTGIELNPTFVHIAADKHNLSLLNQNFETLDEYPPADYIVGCSIFLNKHCYNETDDLERIFNIIDKMYNASNLTVSFNMLSSLCIDKQIDDLLYVNPGFMLDILVSKYTNVTIRHNFSTNMFTIQIDKF